MVRDPYWLHIWELTRNPSNAEAALGGLVYRSPHPAVVDVSRRHHQHFGSHRQDIEIHGGAELVRGSCPTTCSYRVDIGYVRGGGS